MSGDTEFKAKAKKAIRRYTDKSNTEGKDNV
jgi:hypothetical protein